MEVNRFFADVMVLVTYSRECKKKKVDTWYTMCGNVDRKGCSVYGCVLSKKELHA